MTPRALPFAAFLIRNPKNPGFSDSTGAELAWVHAIDWKAGTAEVVSRVGRRAQVRTVRFESLASTPAAAARKLQENLLALLARPPQPAVAGMTASGAESIPAKPAA